MLRIIVGDVDGGMAINLGGPAHSTVKSFDVDLPDLERYLREYEDADSNRKVYWQRSVIGVEVCK